VSSPRILLVRFSSLGDVLLMTPLIRALRARHPAATLTALTKQSWAPLLSANPHLDEVVTVAPGQSLVPLARAIRGERFTHLLDLHGSVRTRVLRLLVPGPWTGYDARRAARQRLIRTHVDRYPDRRPVAERGGGGALRAPPDPGGVGRLDLRAQGPPLHALRAARDPGLRAVRAAPLRRLARI